MIAEGNNSIEYSANWARIHNVLNCFSSLTIHPKVTITQIYKNEESVAIEAIYKFPIQEAAAICGFEAEIDGNRTVKGIAKEAQQAAKEYDEAIQVCIKWIACK